MKFLIIRFSSIGDIVLTSPVVRCLKLQVKDAEVHFLVKKRFKSVVTHNPYLTKVHELGDDWDEMITALKSEQFDYVIDLHHNLRTLRVKKALKVPSFAFNKLNIEKLIFVKLKWNIMPEVHIIDRYLDTVKSFGVKNDGEGMDYFIPENEKVKDQDIPASHQLGYVAIVIGASFYTKKLPVEKLRQLCSMIKYPVMLLGDQNDFKEGHEIAKIDNVKVYNACGKFTLNESADLVRRSKLVIAHDTGLMHIAAALKKQVIAIWGSTTPSLGMVPYYGDRYLYKNPKPSDDVQVHKLWCRPCTKMGRNRCPQGHFKCMKNINLEEIVRIMNLRLGLNSIHQ